MPWGRSHRNGPRAGTAATPAASWPSPAASGNCSTRATTWLRPCASWACKMTWPPSAPAPPASSASSAASGVMARGRPKRAPAKVRPLARAPRRSRPESGTAWAARREPVPASSAAQQTGGEPCLTGRAQGPRVGPVLWPGCPAKVGMPRAALAPGPGAALPAPGETRGMSAGAGSTSGRVIAGLASRADSPAYAWYRSEASYLCYGSCREPAWWSGGADLLGVLAGDGDLAWLGCLVHRDGQGQHAGGVVGVDVVGVEGVAEEHLAGEGAGRAFG